MVLMMASCGSDERTVETIPIPLVVDQCLDELQAAGQPISILGTPADQVQLCVVLQGLDCVLIEPLCTASADCPTPQWSCADPGLEIEDGETLDVRLFIVSGMDGPEACLAVDLTDPPTCAGSECLARVDYELTYAGGDGPGLEIGSAPVIISHSGYLSEEVGTFVDQPASICSAISNFSCEGDGCDDSIRIDLNLEGVGSGQVDLASEARAFSCDQPRCTVFLPSGRSATLTSSAAEGSVFGDWGDACSSEGRSTTCALQPSGETVVTARFGYRLDVQVLGQGSVRSPDGGLDGDGINCESTRPEGQRCEEDFVTEQRIQLVANETPGWPFSRWSGCESTSGTTCTVRMSEARSVTAVFGRQVSIEVEGQGTVAVSPGNGTCSGSCVYAFTPGEQVTLQATAGMNATLYDWQGACAGETGDQCDLGPIDQNLEVVVRFGYDVTTIADASRGRIDRVESLAPVPCRTGGDDCRSYARRTNVTFTAVPNDDPAYAFTGWRGLCAQESSPICNLNITEAGSVEAIFERAVLLAVNVQNEGQAAGGFLPTVEPNATNCNGPCTDRYLLSTGEVTLTAVTPRGTRFLGWSGDACEGTTATQCVVDLTADGAPDRTVVARFTSEERVTVSFVGDGMGTVDAGPRDPTWTCGPTQCFGDFAFGEEVEFTPSADSGSQFVRFSASGQPDCNGTTCRVTIENLDIGIDAQFEEEQRLRVVVSGGAGATVVLPPSLRFDQPAPLPCTDDICERWYLSNEMPLLVAELLPDVTVDRWENCSPLPPTFTSCEVTMDESTKVVTAAFIPPRSLALSLVGSGGGLVVVNGGAEPDCRGVPPPAVSCSSAYPNDTPVILEAPVQLGTDFVGWEGDGSCTGTNRQCSLVMDRDRVVQARFAERDVQVTLDFGGAGAALGTVEWRDEFGNILRLPCIGPGSCSANIREGTTVRLRRSAAPGGQFWDWDGCTPVGVDGLECELVALNGIGNVTAFFAAEVQVRVEGSGRGRVLWNTPPRTSCEVDATGAPGAACPIEPVVQGPVVLTAEAANVDTEFVAWTGCDEPDPQPVPPPPPSECRIADPSGGMTVTALFAELHDINISLGGDGDGLVTWMMPPPSFVACVPDACPSQSVRQGTTVVLKAESVDGTSFVGWSNCAPLGPTDPVDECRLPTVSGDRFPVATYFDDRLVNVEVTGSGTAGIVFSVDGAFFTRCGPARLPPSFPCPETVPYPAMVTLTATVGEGTTFSRWLGCPTEVGQDCVIDVQNDAPLTLTAEFTDD